MMWKGEGEKKHSMSSNCSTIQQKHGRRQPGRYVAIIELNTRQDKALVPKRYSGISLICQCLDPIPSSLLSEWKTT